MSIGKIWWNFNNGKFTNLYFKFWVIENPWNYEIGTGPLVSCPRRLTSRAGYARRPSGDRTPLVATALRAAWHATHTLCSVRTLTKKSAIPSSPSSSLVPLLCYSLHYGPPLYSLWPATAELLPSPSNLGERLAVVASSSSTELELEPSVIDARRVSSPRCLLLPCGSSSTTVLQPPLSQLTIPWAPSSSPTTHRPEVPL
jgi:hypothetical protein